MSCKSFAMKLWPKIDLTNQIVRFFDQKYFKKKSMDHLEFDVEIDKQRNEKTWRKNLLCLNLLKIVRGTQVAWWIYRYQNEQKGKLHHFFYFWIQHHRKGLPKLSRNEYKNYQALYFLCLTFWFLLPTKRSHILK